MVTLYDVAREAGVSTATVSRVVHGQDRVSDSTRLRVMHVIEQLGYVPDGAAQSLSRRRKEIIGFVCVESHGRQYDVEAMNLLYYDEVMRGVGAAVSDRGWSLLITYVDGEPERDFPRLRALSGKVDGIIIGQSVVPAPVLAQIADRVPVVVIGGAPAERAVDVVTADNRSGSAALVTHLIEVHGRRRLFCVDGPADVSDARERRTGVERVLRAHPGTSLVGSYQGKFSVQSGVSAGESLLERHGDALPDAVVAANDQMAIGAIQALNRAGVRTPQDVAVVGFDDIYPGGLNDPPLTTVHQPMRLLGERACIRLLDRIARPELHPRAEVLPTELVVRSSCGCSPDSAVRQPVKRTRRSRQPDGSATGPPQTAARRRSPGPADVRIPEIVS
ncbi:MAG TPA: LacI family DNA-binding transcriptional regulator [Streptosporangiaceae bacterium]